MPIKTLNALFFSFIWHSNDPSKNQITWHILLKLSSQYLAISTFCSTLTLLIYNILDGRIYALSFMAYATKGKRNWACKCKFEIALKCNVDDRIMYFYTTDYIDIMLIPYYIYMIFPLLLSNLRGKYYRLIKLFVMIVRQLTYNIHILLVLLL